MKLSRQELMTAVYAWVVGVCWEWNLQAQQFTLTFDDQDNGFQAFVHRTHEVIWRYLMGRQVLDGTVSDNECVWATQALVIFGDHIEREEPRPGLRQLQASMVWWNGMSPPTQQEFREEYPDNCKSAADIARLWVKLFPKRAVEV